MGEVRSSTIVRASAAAKRSLVGCLHQVAVGDEDVVPQRLLHRAEDERRLAEPPRREQDDVLAVAQVGGELVALALAVDEGVVERQGPERERVHIHIQKCIIHFCRAQGRVIRSYTSMYYMRMYRTLVPF